MKIDACHEDWSQMTPNSQGRHCAICDLTVLNLKDKSLDEVEDLHESNGKICGRVTKVQLSEYQYLHPMKRFAIALFLVFGTGLFTTSYAQVLEETEQLEQSENQFQIKFRAAKSDGTPLEGVYINFDTQSDYKEGSTNEKGELILSFSDTASTKEVYVNISYNEFYGTVQFNASSDNINEFDRIIYDPENYVLKVGKLEFNEVFIMGDIAPIDWIEDPYEQKTEDN